MADWKTTKGYGPWPFRKQKNKWGYLNNPRWLVTPRPFFPTGPDDYDGRSAEEPQIWTSSRQQRYPAGTAIEHHQCGHWHLEGYVAPAGPSPPPPLIEGFWWQPSVDAWKEEGSLALSARQNLDEGVLIRAVKGVINEAGGIDWSEQMQFLSAGLPNEPPLRLVTEAMLEYTLAFEFANPSLWMFRKASGLFSMEEVFVNDEWQNDPWWEEFDMHTNGRVVVISSTDNDGLRLRVSNDYGATFGPKIVIDYLYALLGEESYNLQFRFTDGVCIQVDEYTGVFYLLTSWSDTVDWFYHWLLLKSTNGTNWEFVYEWDNSDYRFETDMGSLAVSDEHIYVALVENLSPLGNPVVYCSNNNGATWTETLFSENYLKPSIVAHRNVGLVMMPYYDGVEVLHYHHKKTVNNGVNWTNNLEINSVGIFTMPTPGYRNIRASGSIFISTYCGAVYPDSRREWKDPDGVVTSMAGVGETPRICFWLSKDDAETWELVPSPLQGWRWWE